MKYKLEKMEAAAKFEKNEQWYELLEFSKQWASEEPNNFMAWQSIGNSFRKLGRVEEAIQAFRKGIEIAPPQPIEFMGILLSASPLWFGLAHAYRASGNNNLAIEAFQEAANINPMSADTWNDLAVAYTNNDDYQNAYEALRKALNVEPTNINVLKNFGLVCAIFGIENKVISTYEILSKLDIKVAEEFRASVQKLKPEIKLPEQMTNIYSEAVHFHNTGNYEKAATLFRLLAEQGLAEAQYQLGSMYYTGYGVPVDYKEAAKWAKAASKNAATEELKNKCDELRKSLRISKISKFLDRIAI